MIREDYHTLTRQHVVRYKYRGKTMNDYSCKIAIVQYQVVLSTAMLYRQA